MSDDKNKDEYITGSIPKNLGEKITLRMKDKGFSSISDYITFVLQQVLMSIEEEEHAKNAFNKEDDEKVKKRLRDLGYID